MRDGWLVGWKPRFVRRALNVATITTLALVLARIGDAEFLLNLTWIIIAIGAFVFGLRQTILRLGLVTLIIAGASWWSSSMGVPMEFQLVELTEWPLMVVISLIVALLADRLNSTARHYAGLYQQASDRLLSAQEDERGRLARDLHDGVGQKLTATILSLDAADTALSARLPDAAGDAQAHVGRARSLAANTLDDVRDVAERLRPPRLVAMGLGSALRDLAESSGMPVEVRFMASVLPPGLLGPDREIEAYRIVQEALGNAARHSHADHVWIDAAAVRGRLRIEVGDDGIGFDRSSPVRGLGLATMRERAAILGATLEVHGSVGRGTVVMLELPLPERTSFGAGAPAAAEPANLSP